MIHRKRPAPSEGESRSEYLRKPWRSASQRVLPVLLGAAVVFSFLSLILGNRGLAQLWELTWQRRELRNELTHLERDAAALRWELGETGAMAVERPAREKFHMQRPGEIVYYFPRESTGRTGETPAPVGPKPTGDPEKLGESR